jgi:ABC-type Zn uptake system ZnuABC Zn-binding protein ZnuA/ABC-type Mn2+/Zn2+ transport system permease subunit
MLDSLDLPFVQRALVDVLLLSVAAGLLGTWIVLRGLAFFTHAAGTAAFPGLVLAEGLGLAGPLGAFAAAVAFAFAVERLGRGRGEYDVVTALALVGVLAAGVVLASDVFASGAGVDSLLFGSLLLVDGGDIALAGLSAALAAAATALLGARWLATGFDPGAARSLGARPVASDAVLLLLVALTATAALAAVGALLAAALLVVPAATARLWTDRLGTWQAAATGLAAAEGVAALLLSVELNAPPGATLAVLGGVVFALAAAVRILRDRQRAHGALAAAALAALLAAPACGSVGAAGGGDRVSVVATTTLVADWARSVGGDRVDVHAILRPNTDPHDYEPRPADVVAAAGADLVLSAGGEVDGWIDEILEAGGADAPHVVLGTDLPVALSAAGHADDGHTHDDGELDPHWWHDPRNVAAAAGRIGGALAHVEPRAAGAFRRRADAYAARVRRVDAAAARCLSGVPAADRKLVTDHDAFAYLAHRYGLEVVGTVIPAASAAAEPSAGDAVALIERIRAEGVAAVFPERSLDPELAETIARETGASADHQLLGDALAPPGSPGDTYLGMVAANADALVRGLTGGRAGCNVGAGT